MGVSYPNHTESVTAIVNSLRRLSNDEKAAITGLKIRLAEAQDGESLQALSERTKNSWNLETTALMNDIDPTVTLKKGQVLKIAVEEPYLAR